VAKTFALAIEEASKLHMGAEPLIVHAALLAPDAIPLFVFGEPLARNSVSRWLRHLNRGVPHERGHPRRAQDL
jgi:hypothetical protein